MSDVCVAGMDMMDDDRVRKMGRRGDVVALLTFSLPGSRVGMKRVFRPLTSRPSASLDRQDMVS
jgi:hypothetical protein